jgi:hypothetical protein
MNNNSTEVTLTILIRGAQAIRGSYEQNNESTNGVKTKKAPIFCKAYKTIKLGNEFVSGALSEAPKHLNMRPQIWKKIPENKRIAIHIGDYVKATHPEHRGYTMKIL